MYYSKEKKEVTDAKLQCAEKGGIILPIKDKAMYYFIQHHASSVQMDNTHLGNYCNELNKSQWEKS